MSFENLPPLLGEALAARGYASLTAVQSAVVAEDAGGRDLLVSAQTGSGKTVAFGLAMVADLFGSAERAPPPGAPLALVIAPTRELALQVRQELDWLYGPIGARVLACVGGMNVRQEQRALAQGCHIVVGTPGRLCDHLEQGALRISAIRTVVLDEADEMLDMGFRDNLEELLDATPAERRTLLFSATMPRPIAELAKAYQRDALRISTIGEARGHGDIAYQAVTVAPGDIERAVVNILRFHDAGGAIVFCATRENVRHLHASLVERGFAAVALSGEHSQNERNQALQALRDRRARVCVATDVAARGIDLPDLRLVIHAELPRDAETLQHRSGRTGRAGKKGTAVLIVPFPRRRRIESMLKGARIAAEWIAPPTVAAIHARDEARLVETLSQPVAADETDRRVAARLIETMSVDDIAAALVRAHRASLPEPEELLGTIAPRAREHDRPVDENRQSDFEDGVWFRMSLGRRHRADPRWLLPLICRRGHVSKAQVGAIRIADSETMFQIARAAADRFSDALRRTASDDRESEGSVRFEQAAAGPGQVRQNPAQRRGRPQGNRPMRRR